MILKDQETKVPHTCQHSQSPELVTVEVVFSSPEKYQIVHLHLPAGTTARQAVLTSKLSSFFPEFELDTAPIGIFGKLVPDNYLLCNHDRVEIYRPLEQSPQVARRNRANKTV